MEKIDIKYLYFKEVQFCNCISETCTYSLNSQMVDGYLQRLFVFSDNENKDLFLTIAVNCGKIS